MARESRMSGALLPAGPKGFGWILLVELLGGLLSGERTWEDEWPATREDRPAHYGQTFVAIDPAHLGDPRELAVAADRMIDTLTGTRPAVGFDGVRLPGGNAAQEQRRRREHGVPVREEEWAMAARLA
jgi:LDH2 family malate/lactate/ureidoglycolate dehydrogenase